MRTCLKDFKNDQDQQAVNNEEQQIDFRQSLASDVSDNHQGGMYDDEYSDESTIHYDDEELDMKE